MRASSWVALGTWTATIAAGCSGSSAGVSSGASDASADASNVTGPPVQPGDFCREYTLARCGALKNCCGGGDAGATFDDTTCISSLRNACDGAMSTGNTEKATFDPNAAGNCVARAAVAACESSVSLDRDCPDLFIGTAKEGDLCGNAKCMPGLICPVYAAPGCMGCPGPPPSTCVRPRQVGEACGTGNTDPCADGLLCQSGNCRAKASIGGGCQGSSDCADDLYCDSPTTKTCQAKHPLGDRCSDLTWCLSGECVSGVCTPATPQSTPFCQR